MSCENGPNRAATGATRGGIPRLAIKAAFYAGVGLATAGAIGVTAYKLMKSTNTSFDRKVSQVISQIQRGATLADSALASEVANLARSDLLKEGVSELVEAWGEIKKLRDRDNQIKVQLTNFLADVLGATEEAEEVLNRPGDQTRLEAVRKVFQSSRLVFLLPRRGPRNKWRTALFAGTAGLAATCVLGLAEWRYRQTQIKKQREITRIETKHHSTILQRNHDVLTVLNPMTDYNSKEFDLEGGQSLTTTFGGARLNEAVLTSAIGAGDSQVRPILKMGGEDDVFLLDGAPGHIYYSRPDEGIAQIVAVAPRQGRRSELTTTLEKLT